MSLVAIVSAGPPFFIFFVWRGSSEKEQERERSKKRWLKQNRPMELERNGGRKENYSTKGGQRQWKEKEAWQERKVQST